MDFDQFPLSMFEVDCDGSACASAGAARHIHAPQPPHMDMPAIARVTVRNGRRTGYQKAEGITRLVMAVAD